MTPEPKQIDALDRLIDTVLDGERPAGLEDGDVDLPTARVVTDLRALAQATPMRTDFVADLEARLRLDAGERVTHFVEARAARDASVGDGQEVRTRPTRVRLLTTLRFQWAHHSRGVGAGFLSMGPRGIVGRRILATSLSIFLAGFLLGAASIAVAAPLRQSLATALREIPGRVQIIGRSQGWPTRLDSRPPTSATPSTSPNLAAAAQIVGFHPLAPAVLPSGYHRQSIEPVGKDTVAFRRSDGTAMPGTIQVFDGPAGMLVILQIETENGTFNWTAADGSYRPIKIRGRDGWFVDGYWERQGSQVVWKAGEEGAFRQLIWSDSRFTYMIRGHLSLDELLRIADGLR